MSKGDPIYSQVNEYLEYCEFVKQVSPMTLTAKKCCYKQFIEIAGESILVRSAKAFEMSGEVDEIVVVTNVENPLAKRVSVSLFDLVGHPFVMMNRNNPYRDRFDLELAHHDLAIEPFCELESDVLVIKLLSANPQYLSVLPRYAVEKSIHRERLAALPVAGCVMRQWRQLLYHKNKVITPQIQGMLDTIATCCTRV